MLPELPCKMDFRFHNQADVIFKNEKVFMRCILLLLLFSQSLLGQTLFYQTDSSLSLTIRFPPPPGFTRVKVAPNSFGAWLRNMPLLKPGSPVKDYRGHIFKKPWDSTVAAVTACTISGRSMDQCMDILMRFYAAYLHKNNRLADLILPLPDGSAYGFTQARQNLVPVFKGLHFRLQPDKHLRNPLSLNRFLNIVFELTGTQAFYYHYRKIPLDSVQPGDFIVKKGRKGHAVLIVDMATDGMGNRMALIGQGDTPACGLYLLKERDGSPWFPISSKQNFPDLPIHKKMYWDGLRRFGERKIR